MTFVCDVMLGKLARYLRVFGLDAIYVKDLASLDKYRDAGESALFFTKRTRSIGFTATVFVSADNPKEQLREIREIIKPHIDRSQVMKRCISCNLELLEVTKDEVEQYVPEYIFHLYPSFRMCPSCKRVYWEGSHTKGMRQLTEEILS
jgi:uncharacterized protein